MPHELLDIRQVARYLDMDEREVARLASRGRLPCQKRKGGVRVRKSDLDHWVETQIHQLPHHRLAEIESGVRRHHGMDDGGDGRIVCNLIPHDGLAVPLNSRTAGSVLRDLLGLAEKAGLLYTRGELLEAIRSREALCSTALLPETALPHPRHHVPYDIAESFIVAGRCDAGIPFGAPDGSLTRLFFLICCKEDRTHLHVLARLSRILRHPDTREDLLTAEDPQQFRTLLTAAESQAVEA